MFHSVHMEVVGQLVGDSSLLSYGSWEIKILSERVVPASLFSTSTSPSLPPITPLSLFILPSLLVEASMESEISMTSRA